jgi:hypothetical protein
MARTFKIGTLTLNKPPLNTELEILDTSIYYRDVEATQRVSAGDIKEVYSVSAWLTSSEIVSIAEAILSAPLYILTTGYSTNISDNFFIKNFKKSNQRVFISETEYELCSFTLEQE